MKLKRLTAKVLFFSFLLTQLNCGSAAENALARAMATIALTSPTTSASSSSASTFSLTKKVYSAFLGFTGLAKIFKISTKKSLAAGESSTGQPTNIKPLSEMKEELKEVINGDPDTAAAELGNPIEKKDFKALCYGPAWTDNARGSNVNRPSGDLGIVYKTAGDTDDRACAAAQVDALLAGAPAFLNNFIKMQAVMIAAAKKKGESLPAEGTEEDWKAHMPTLTGVTLTKAEIAQLTKRADGTEIYKTEFGFTDANSKSGSITIYHSPKNVDNTEFEGIIYGTVPHTASMGGTGDKRAMSMVYSSVGGVSKFSAKIAANRSTTSSDFFDSNNEVDFSKETSSREDFHWILGQMNESTKEATLHYAWQAGGGDGATRTFAMHVPAGTDGSLTGTAWAGYGPAINTLTAANAPWTQKFYCDWLDGLSNGTSQTKVQRQGVKQVSGKFKVDDTNNKIAFAPVPTCKISGTFTVSNGAASFLNGVRTVTEHELQTPPTSTEAPVITAPTYSIPKE